MVLLERRNGPIKEPDSDGKYVGVGGTGTKEKVTSDRFGGSDEFELKDE